MENLRKLQKTKGHREQFMIGIFALERHKSAQTELLRDGLTENLEEMPARIQASG